MKVFIIGPFFTDAEASFMLKVKERLKKRHEVKTPIDIGYTKDGSEEFFKEDLQCIEESDVIVAILDGHDPGTMCEIGYARAIGKRIIGLWTDKERRLDVFVKWLCHEVVGDIEGVERWIK
ncbi:MAG: nucleoside 2-deoxyribosyltransferase [Candidatus Methanospirareceae archaeon]